ncbi:MAG: DEAD/DEAH box helicase [Sedimentisphaerales bacterium]|nr:DEAD/DEAH box helicase [Sedimentisphaerales bacterium]
MTDNCIRVSTSFRLKDVCKSIPGARWNKNTRTWDYPATPISAKNILSRPEFADFKVDLEVTDLLSTLAMGAFIKDCPDDLKDLLNVKTKPWLHQLQGSRLAMTQSGTMLAFDMGTGKTKTTIDAICNMPELQLVLIISPKSVVSNWPKEFDKHASFDRRVKIVAMGEGTLKKRGQLLDRVIQHRQGLLIIIMNYDAVYQGDVGKVVAATEWDLVVADEIHRIKSPSGVTSKFFANKIKAKKRIGLTGTPMPHSPLDVFAQYRFLDPAIFGRSFTMFRARYAVMGGFEGKQVLRFQNLDELEGKFNSIALKVSKDEVLDLPPFVDEVRNITLEPEARRVYRELEKEFIADVGGGVITVNNALSRLVRLQQVTSGYLPDPTDPDEDVNISNAKAKALLEVFEDLPSDAPVVVFCRFRCDLSTTAIMAAKAGRKCFELSGTINQLEEWQNRAEGGDVLAVQIQSGKEGVDFTRACYCVYYSVSWSLGTYDQSRARVHRQGQTRSVTYIHLVAEDTVDAKVYKSFSQKKKIIESVLKMYQKGEADG